MSADPTEAQAAVTDTKKLSIDVDAESTMDPELQELDGWVSPTAISEEAREQKTVVPAFDLLLAMRALKDDKPELAAKLAEDEAKVREVRAQIVTKARKSHILERKLTDLEDKIQLLLRNQQKFQEQMSQLNDHKGDEKGESGSLAGKRGLYEELFYLLQVKPRYVAKLARQIQKKHAPALVQTIVFDLFGDQYDTRQERLLLQMFYIMIKDELGESTDMGSLMRANTAVTQMLSAYARRGQGLTALKNILGEPLRSLCQRTSLKLEIKPRNIYTDLIKDYETKEGKVSDLNKEADDEEAEKHPDVQKILAERKVLLLDECLTVLRRILDAAEEIPYGMRWLCKQLGEVAKSRFPDISDEQVTSLMGGYIYLRFFNPAVVNPMDFVADKPSKNVKRNLILIAKVLQNLSNGHKFGHKETYMMCLNGFIEENSGPLQDYFQHLVMVDDLGEAVQLDRLFESSQMSSNAVQLSLNNIFLVHELLLLHLDAVAPLEKDPIREILSKLGEAPKQLSRSLDRPVALTLQPPKGRARLSQAVSSFGSDRVHKLVEQCKRELTLVLLELPQPETPPGLPLVAFLKQHEERLCALETPTAEEKQLGKRVKKVITLLRTIYTTDLIEHVGKKGEDDEDESYHSFLMAMVQQALTRQSLMIKVQKRSEIVQKALDSITAHHEALLARRELYNIYLDNVRKGAAQDIQSTAKAGKKSKARSPRPVKPYKIDHPTLEARGVITSCSVPVSKSVLKKCFYIFTMQSPGIFKVEVQLKKGISINLLDKPYLLVLDDLLQMQDAGKESYTIDAVTLNVNLLIHLFNTQFQQKS